MTSLITTRIGMYHPPPTRATVSRKKDRRPARLFLLSFLSLLLLFTPLGGIFEFVSVVSAEEITGDVTFCTTNCTTTETSPPPLRVPWMYGTTVVTRAYDCISHIDAYNDRYAVDFSLNKGTPLAAVFSGTAYTGYDGPTTALGRWVAIHYGNGWVAMYGHLDKINVMNGQEVKQGQYIGNSGSTGNSTGPHLHFLLHKNATERRGKLLNGISIKPEPLGISAAAATDKIAESPYTNWDPTCSPAKPATKSLKAYDAASGKWISPTPADRTKLPIGPSQWQLTARGYVVDSGYVDSIRINIKVGNGAWQNVKTQYFSDPVKSAETSVTITATSETIYYSFDVYERYSTNIGFSFPYNGFNLVADGVRVLCSPSLTQSQCDSLQVFSGNVLPGANGYPGYGGSGESCTVAPTTTPNTSGATMGNNGWWRSNVNVSFNVDAPCGYIGLQTKYSINGGAIQTYSDPFTLNQEGIHNITYYSVDGVGNVESTKSVEVKIDWTPPVTTGSATGPRDTNGIFRDNVTAGLSSTDNLSGVENQQRSVDGGTNWITQAGANNTFEITGNGVSRFVFRATDKAGNVENQKDSGPIIINKYVIFSNGTSNSLRFLRSSGVNITGDIYSGGTVTVQENTNSIFGTTMKTVGTANVISSSNTGVTVPSITTGTPSVPMLSYPLSMYKSLATVVFPSDLYMNSVSSQLKGIIYVEGNVEMLDVGLSGPVSIVSTGTITDITTDSSFQTGDPNNGVLLYSGKDIIVNSTGNRNLGLMYAPTGIISINATGLTLKGSLVANQVELNGATNFNLSYSAAFASTTHALPLTAMGLVSNTSPLPALPSVPVLSSPSKGSSAYVSKTRLLWKTSTGAVGYQLQVAKDASFTTVVHDGSYLYAGATLRTLQKGTKYYWRVRSINQAGMSSWSTTWDFLGK
jgi:hypothetical protein